MHCLIVITRKKCPHDENITKKLLQKRYTVNCNRQHTLFLYFMTILLTTVYIHIICTFYIPIIEYYICMWPSCHDPRIYIYINCCRSFDK